MTSVKGSQTEKNLLISFSGEGQARNRQETRQEPEDGNTVGSTSLIQSGMDRQESMQERDGTTGRNERGDIFTS